MFAADVTVIEVVGSHAIYASKSIYFNGETVETSHYRRSSLIPGDRIQGPAMVTEYTSATIIPPGCSAHVDGFANLIIAISGEARV